MWVVDAFGCGARYSLKACWFCDRLCAVMWFASVAGCWQPTSSSNFLPHSILYCMYDTLLYKKEYLYSIYSVDNHKTKIYLYVTTARTARKPQRACVL